MRVVTFGEIMLRLAPNGYYRFFQDDQLQATFGGGDANVAVSLANYGLDAAYVTKLPKHAIGQAAVNQLRYFGVDTSSIVRGGDRVGIYFLEKALPREVPYVSMTALIPRSRRQILPNSTGKRSYRAPTGSISPVSHRPSDRTWWRRASMPAR